ARGHPGDVAELVAGGESEDLRHELGQEAGDEVERDLDARVLGLEAVDVLLHSGLDPVGHVLLLDHVGADLDLLGAGRRLGGGGGRGGGGRRGGGRLGGLGGGRLGRLGRLGRRGGWRWGGARRQQRGGGRADHDSENPTTTQRCRCHACWFSFLFDRVNGRDE